MDQTREFFSMTCWTGSEDTEGISLHSLVFSLILDLSTLWPVCALKFKCSFSRVRDEAIVASDRSKLLGFVSLKMGILKETEGFHKFWKDSLVFP